MMSASENFWQNSFGERVREAVNRSADNTFIKINIKMLNNDQKNTTENKGSSNTTPPLHKNRNTVLINKQINLAEIILFNSTR
jgi:hypothetical protein